MKSWKLIKENTVYAGWRRVVTRTFEMPNGKRANFDIIPTDRVSVAVLALTPDDEVVTFYTFRVGPQEYLHELPGGGVEDGEELIVAVARELREETGYEADIEHIGSYWRDAYMTGRWQMFVGTNARKVGEPQLDNEEFGETRLLSVDDFRQLLVDGNLTDSTLGYAGLRHLDKL